MSLSLIGTSKFSHLKINHHKELIGERLETTTRKVQENQQRGKSWDLSMVMWGLGSRISLVVFRIPVWAEQWQLRPHYDGLNNEEFKEKKLQTSFKKSDFKWKKKKKNSSKKETPQNQGGVKSPVRTMILYSFLTCLWDCLLPEKQNPSGTGFSTLATTFSKYIFLKFSVIVCSSGSLFSFSILTTRMTKL